MLRSRAFSLRAGKPGLYAELCRTRQPLHMGHERFFSHDFLARRSLATLG